MTINSFSDAEIAAVYKAIAERRDIRHFLPEPLDADLMARLLHAAHLAPSVGFMQPWRFIRISDPALRAALHRSVEEERVRTAQALGEREDEFMRLKVEGIRECGELLVVALMARREAHIFGRRTLPEMDLASVACAIQNMWLAARAEGIGMGWVSMFEPQQLRALLAMPADAKPVAILCLGRVAAFYPKPMLELEGWAQRKPLETVVYDNVWTDAAAGAGSPKAADRPSACHASVPPEQASVAPEQASVPPEQASVPPEHTSRERT
jgi:5,6-dimethylbenzimidazole synthase